jgi:uncharacterized protein YecE (DUF72 family)
VDSVSQIKIGTTAWSFDDWRGPFYPEGLAQTDWLPFYAQRFSSVEVDSTFYHAPAPHVTEHWLEATPDDFTLSLKLSRDITHDRKLRESEELLGEFLIGIEPLRPKLAYVLIQLPPFFTLKHDEQALREFVRRLPGDFRFAIEFRDGGWHLPRIIHLLEDHQVCWAWTDVTDLEHAKEAAFDFLPRTTDFIAVRLLGDLESKYQPDGSRNFHYRELVWPRDVGLENWAEKIQTTLPDVTQCFIYAANHFEGFAPASARRMANALKVTLPEPPPSDESGSTDEQLDLF